MSLHLFVTSIKMGNFAPERRNRKEEIASSYRGNATAVGGRELERKQWPVLFGREGWLAHALDCHAATLTNHGSP